MCISKLTFTLVVLEEQREHVFLAWLVLILAKIFEVRFSLCMKVVFVFSLQTVFILASLTMYSIFHYFSPHKLK